MTPFLNRDFLFRLATLTSAATLLLFYLFPYTIPQLGFSPHTFVLAIGVGFLLPDRLVRLLRLRRELTFPGLFAVSVLFSILGAPAGPVMSSTNAWLLSLAAFWLFRETFNLLSHRHLDIGIHILLLLWSLLSIAQVLFGGCTYVAACFIGAIPPSIYAMGLTTFSNYAAICLLPLLIWTLVFNLDKLSLWRSGVWMIGCAALYYTLSRAGWLASGVALFILAVKVSKTPDQIRALLWHVGLAFVAICLAWIAPTKLDEYEPFGAQSHGRWSLLDGDYSSATRIVTLQVGLRALSEHPWTGIGLGRFPEYYQHHYHDVLANKVIDPRAKITPHNGYLQVITELGIPAFVALIFWISSLITKLAQQPEPSAHVLYASILGMLAWLVFHDGLSDRQLWILLGCAAALTGRYLPQRQCQS